MGASPITPNSLWHPFRLTGSKTHRLPWRRRLWFGKLDATSHLNVCRWRAAEHGASGVRGAWKWYMAAAAVLATAAAGYWPRGSARGLALSATDRSEEHTSELQSPCN